MFGENHHHAWPQPSLECETWRCKTMEQLISLAGRDTITSGISEPQPEGVKVSVLNNRLIVTTIIEGHFTMKSPECDRRPFRQLVDKAFGLAMQMSLQRPRLQVPYPAVGAMFNRREMSSLPGPDKEDDDEPMGDEVVAFVIDPGLTKWGDAHGENFGERYDIVPSLVHLEPANIKREAEKDG
jgi:hypothetical protein